MKTAARRLAQTLMLALAAALPDELAAQMTMPGATMPPADTTMPPPTTAPTMDPNNPVVTATQNEEKRDMEFKTRAQLYTMRISSLLYASRNKRFPADVRAKLASYSSAVRAKLKEAKEEGDLAREVLSEVWALIGQGKYIDAALRLLDAITHMDNAAHRLAEAEDKLKEAEAYLVEMLKTYPELPPEPEPIPEPAPTPTPTSTDMGDGGPILP